MRKTSAMLGALLVGAAASAQQPGDADASALDWIQVTATRFADPVQEVPNAISVIPGDELRARGAYDLRSALALVGGAFVAPGGDFGPGRTVHVQPAWTAGQELFGVVHGHVSLLRLSP